MKRKLIPLMALSLFGVLATSCGSNGIKYQAENPTTTYKWDRNNDGELGYVVLIGDKGHNDSNARTEGCERALVELGKKLNLTIHELASKEMKNNAGSTWDAATAGEAVGGWITQFGDKLDLIVSNNDGMAAASYANSNWPKGLPIFGFDALPSAAKDIKDGKLTGSITQNGDAQARAALQLIRNYADGVEDPLNTGITKEDKYHNKVQRCTVEYDKEERKLLVPCATVTKENCDQYLSGIFETINPVAKETKTLNVLCTIYNNGDNFLKEVYKKSFDNYAKSLNINITYVEGDGTSETTCLDKFINLDNYDAYLVNMVKTESGQLYTSKLTGKNAEKPLIFYNRQPAEGSVIDKTTMNFNDKTYYIGVNTAGSGDLQGKLITDWLTANK